MKRDESWFNCEFHLNDDANRVVKVAIMLYHILRYLCKLLECWI